MQPQRKPVRLQEYDYNSIGYYFITICTIGKKSILGTIVGAETIGVPQMQLSDIGEIVEKFLSGIRQKERDISIDKYIVMPNHIHLILCIGQDSGTPRTPFAPKNQGSFGDPDICGTPRTSSPTKNDHADNDRIVGHTNAISNTIGYIKRETNKLIGSNIWQRSFYDHVIRNEKDYLRIWEYIDTNPIKWAYDEYYQ